MTTKSKSKPKKDTTEILSVEHPEMELFISATKKLERQIDEKYPEELVEVLKKISYEIAVIGLTEREACLIASYPYDVFVRLKQRDPMIQQLVEMKDLEYKRSLLKQISEKARTTDDKLGQWLLEARYPEQFNRKKGSGKGDGDEESDNLLAMAVDFVRKSGDSNNLVTEESGRAFVVKASSKKKAITDINQFLK